LSFFIDGKKNSSPENEPCKNRDALSLSFFIDGKKNSSPENEPSQNRDAL